jgi:phosphate-selective porin OprO/OprP
VPKHPIRALMAAGLACAALTSPACAQDDPRLSGIEAQIRSLQAELARVRRDLNARSAALRQVQRAPAAVPAAASAPAPSAAPDGGTRQASAGGTDRNGPPSSVAPPSTSAPAAPANPGGVSFPKGRPTLTSNDGRFSLAVGLQLHYDVAGVFQGSRTQDTRQIPRLDTFGQNLRRARIPFVFAYDDFQINVTPDFGNSPDGTPTLYEANINWTPVKPLTVTAGYFKPWLTLQDSMSSNDFLFLERPSIVEASRNIAAGDARSSAGLRWAENRYFAAAYLTGAPYGSQSTAPAQPQQTGATLRLAGRPVASEDWDLHAGFSASDAFRIQRTAAGQTLTVQDRPELRVDNTRLVSTGPLNARSAYTYGPEFGLRWRNLMLQGEYITIGVDRTDGGAAVRTPGLTFSGGYAEASWVITGEPRRYASSSAAFGNPRPAHPFSLKEGGAGAFELVGRFSHIDLNDRVTRGQSAASTGGVFGGRQDVYAVGLNWYPNEQLRFMLDYDIIAEDRLNAAGTTQIGQHIQAVALRAQAAF